MAHSGPAETGLLGISLYDPGIKIIKKYGSPDQIQGLATSGQAIGGAPSGGGAPGRGGPAGGGGVAPRGGGSGGAPASVEADIDRPGPLGSSVIGDPFGEAESFLQGRPPGVPPGANFGPPGAGVQGPPRGASGGPPNGQFGPPAGGRPAGLSGAGGGGAGAGAPNLGGGGGAGTKVIYTRWVYKRDNSRYAFVLDKFNRVVQIEAIGLTNAKVKTKRGLGFGSTFAQLIDKHSAPDGYEISGDNLVVRYLVRDHVAYRLSRVAADKPHRVTGIVVAAGKT